jgi:hypothetical protein
MAQDLPRRREKFHLKQMFLKGAMVADEELEARAGIEPAHKGFAVFRTTPKSL